MRTYFAEKNCTCAIMLFRPIYGDCEIEMLRYKNIVMRVYRISAWSNNCCGTGNEYRTPSSCSGTGTRVLGNHVTTAIAATGANVDSQLFFSVCPILCNSTQLTVLLS